jgi:hypothetical protein
VSGRGPGWCVRSMWAPVHQRCISDAKHACVPSPCHRRRRPRPWGPL